jgi:Xaa-Pro dipeptidase
MQIETLYADHLRSVQRDVEAALERAGRAGRRFAGVVFHAGTQAYYHADDRSIDFRPAPHFARFAPVAGPDHLVVAHPGAAPRLIQVVPQDYWYEVPAAPTHPYARVLHVTRVATPEQARAAAGDVSRCAYVGGDPATAAALGIAPDAVEPAALLAPLDWSRGFKTPYEVECIRAAARSAARGHGVVRDGLAAGWSERRLHFAYLEASGQLEWEVPYANIIAWDEASATLHYQTKRSAPPAPGRTLLVDAGATSHGYASDVTRTYTRDGAHPAFRRALDGMDRLQRELVERVRPEQSFLELHEAAHRGVAAILHDIGVLRTDPEAAFERGLTRPFLPHGLGHHLGLQVHDIGGRQVTADGERREPPAHYPYLRTTRDLAPGHVVTIEPGLYFIPMLLEPLRGSADAAALDWKLVDELVPCGGIRVEDDILVTERGHEDLTRGLIPGHRGV